MFIIVLGQRVSILIQSTSGPYKIQIPQRILNIAKQGYVS